MGNRDAGRVNQDGLLELRSVEVKLSAHHSLLNIKVWTSDGWQSNLIQLQVGVKMGGVRMAEGVNVLIFLSNYRIYGGQRGIRTLETVTRLHAFQACAFNHSATCPVIPSREAGI